jgi:RsiW-degrading membrane proteinase PrsW (M82 family)
MNVAVSLLPVFLFLVSLIAVDSYKLIKFRTVLLTIALGAAGALVALLVSIAGLGLIGIPTTIYVRYCGPLVEEILKSAYLVYLIRSQRVGFMVDAAIQGFAIGAGFSFVENIYYLSQMTETNMLVWVVRGFGTAIMHGGTTAVFAIISKNLYDRKGGNVLRSYLPGLGIAIVIHSLYNHFFLPPVQSTFLLLVGAPAVLYVTFRRSSDATREWLGVGLDADMELLQLITSGNFVESNIGKYLYSLRERFPGELIADMMGLLRLNTELAMKAKGILIMREAGFSPLDDPEVREKLGELKYLEKNIGPTGMAAIRPFLHTSTRALWQVYMLKS